MFLSQIRAFPPTDGGGANAPFRRVAPEGVRYNHRLIVRFFGRAFVTATRAGCHFHPPGRAPSVWPALS